MVVLGGAHTPLAIKLKYTFTNNIAKYEACIIGMEAALSLGVDKIDIFGDSNLIISQIQGEWKVKHEKLRPYHEYLESLRAKFKQTTFSTPRREPISWFLGTFYLNDRDPHRCQDHPSSH